MKFISLTDSNIRPNTFLDQLAVCDKASLLGTRGITVQAPIKKTNYLNPRSNQNQNLIYIFQFEFPTLILYFEETLLYDQISKTLFWKRQSALTPDQTETYFSMNFQLWFNILKGLYCMAKYIRLFFGPPCESWQSVTFGNRGDYCASPHEKTNYLNPRSNKTQFNITYFSLNFQP